MVESSSECWLGNRSAMSRSLARKNIMKEDERGALLDASSYPPETEAPSFHRRRSPELKRGARAVEPHQSRPANPA
jgi:hypothetical protein